MARSRSRKDTARAGTGGLAPRRELRKCGLTPRVPGVPARAQKVRLLPQVAGDPSSQEAGGSRRVDKKGKGLASRVPGGKADPAQKNLH